MKTHLEEYKQDWRNKKWSDSERKFLRLLEKRNEVIKLFEKISFANELKKLEKSIK